MIYFLRSAFVLAVFLIFQLPLFAQSSEDSGFNETLRIGRGAIQQAEWQSNGSLILVDTIRGAWLYSVSDNGLIGAGHFEDAWLATFAPDGEVFASANPHHEIVLRKTDNFQVTATLSGHQTTVRALEWNPNGHQVAALDTHGVIFVWDILSPETAVELILPSADRILWSPGGTRLAAIDFDTRSLHIWHTTGKLISRPVLPNSSFIWRNECQILVQTSDESATGELWDVETAKRLESPRVGFTNAYNPEGSILAAGFYGQIEGIDTETDESLWSIPFGDFAPSILSWSPDGRKVAFAEWTLSNTGDAQVIIVDAATGTLRYEHTYEFPIREIVWQPNSEGFLVIDQASRIYISTTGLSSSDAHTEIGTTAAWRSDGKVILAADTNAGARLWDTKTGEGPINRMSQQDPISKMAWQPGGTLLATAVGDYWEGANHHVMIWDSTVTGDEIYEQAVVIPHVNPVMGLAWSPDGTTLAAIEQQRYIRLWKPAEPDNIRVIDLWKIRLTPAVDNGVMNFSISWSSRSDTLTYSYTGSGYGGVGWIDVNTGMIQPTAYTSRSGSAWTWTPDNRFIWTTWNQDSSTGAYSLSVRDVRATADENTTIELPPVDQPIRGGVFSPNAELLVGFDISNNAIIWDLQTQAVITRLPNVSDGVWSPDSKLLTVYGKDGVQVIDARTGEEIHHFDPSLSVYGRPEVIWSPDSQHIALLVSGVLFIYDKRSEI